MIRHAGSSHPPYVDSEIGTIRKDRVKGRVKVALVYPNTYPVGMSNLGFQTVYRLFNNIAHVVCERAFLPPEGPFSHAGGRTLETRRRLTEFDIIAFSISFENDYPHVLTILKNAGLPLKAEERTSSMPLVIAGGVACFLNPEPLASFVDCFFIGEAEPVIPEFFEIYHPEKERGPLLRSLARDLTGIYVPSLYRTTYYPDGTIKTFEPAEDAPLRIHRTYVKDLSEISTTSVVVTPNTTFGSMFLIEVGRGCPHGCRFCSAGYVYRPYRFRKAPQLISSLETGLSMTDRIGLVGAAVTDLPDLPLLCEKVIAGAAQVSFSSFRADRLSSELVSVIGQSRLKTATIAPDAGSERMRKIIRKGITEEDILTAVEKLVDVGVLNIKLYFMIGLPMETMDDIVGIVDLCRRIKRAFLAASRKTGRMGHITVSVNPFVPKPSTPFQRAPMDTCDVLKKKIQIIREGLKKLPNVRVLSETPKQAFFQALLARGNQKVGDVLLRSIEGRRNRASIFKETYMSPEFYALRERAADEIFPWGHIDQGFEVSLLEREYEKSKKAST